MKSVIKKFFYGLLACCLVFGLQSACGAVLCIGADGQVSIEMTCGALAFPQQHSPASFPLPSDFLSDQEGDAGCDQCAMDIPIPGVADGVRVMPSGPSLLLPPVCQLAALVFNDPGRDQSKAANYYAALVVLDHAIAMLRTTVLLI